jgi:arsenate reductase
MTAHWGMPDPAAVQGDADTQRRAFLDTFVTMQRRLRLMLSLPLASLDALAIKKEIKDIGTR